MAGLRADIRLVIAGMRARQEQLAAESLAPAGFRLAALAGRLIEVGGWRGSVRNCTPAAVMRS